MVSGLVSFGPVLYSHDYALLSVTAYSSVTGEPVPGARLKVVPGDGFEGYINSQDPAVTPVSLVTGGRGTASFVYTPPAVYGQYLAPTSVSGSQITLPVPVPIQQLWNADDGWLVRLYAVLNNDPLFGKVGAVTVLGEIPWRTVGTPGTAGYLTNGRRVPLLSAGSALLPSDALDAAGHSYTHPAFSGTVATLQYAASVAAPTGTGAYLLAYVGSFLIQVEDLDTGIVSNQISLTLDVPPSVSDGLSYLTLDDGTSGLLNEFPLGGEPIIPNLANLTRY
jgi:hypothetical protein